MRAKTTTWRLGLDCCDLPGGFLPQNACLALHTLTPFCVEMLMEQLSEPFICPVHSASIHATTATIWDGSYWAFFNHVAQGTLGNAETSGLSLYLSAGRTPQILNKHLHQSLQVNQESQPSLTPFQACKDFFLFAFPLSEEVYIRILLKFKIPHLPPPKSRGTKEALKTPNMQIIKCFHMQKNGCF